MLSNSPGWVGEKANYLLERAAVERRQVMSVVKLGLCSLIHAAIARFLSSDPLQIITYTLY